jgi:hypothetical protein
MKVLPTQTGDAVTTPVADTRTDAANTRAFKAALAQAATDTSQAGTDVTTTTTTATDGNVAVKLRDGETMEHVDGHAYAEITSGSRDGMFINTSGNVRSGQTFVLVRKNGKEYHVYGTGKDRLVVGFHMPSSKPADDTGSTGGSPSTPKSDLPDIKLRKGEKMEPVEGHAYAEITSGPRSGMYINTSSNSRRGEAFVLVEKAGFDYHIYGSGDDRTVIRANKRDDDDK